MPGFLNETQIEDIVMNELAALGFGVARGADISPDGDRPERATYADVVLVERLREALGRINPQLPASAIEEAIGKVRDVAGQNLIESNRKFHRLLVDGVPVDYRNDAGDTIHDFARLIDRAELGDNDWLAVRQFTVKEASNQRRLDVVVFVNGLPLAVFELKSPEAEQATVRGAFNQFETYKNDIPSLLVYNAFLVISDGIDTRMGTITSEWERFVPWKTEDGKTVAPATADQLGVLLRGVFDRARLIDLIREFIVFEDDGQAIQKKVAAYHQFHAVNKAIDETVRATRTKGDRKIGVVWHTQGSGKSLSMVFYAGKVIQHSEMDNPTLVVLTDRNDLDDQLFGTFSRCSSLLRQSPVQADSRAHLRDLLSVASGGVIFTTIQKFAPEDGREANEKLSDRKNIVVIADEAHRSQYGFAAKYNRDTGTKKYGLAQHMREALPHASFIGFTGTPIEQEDKSTPAVFGNYIDIYDIQRAVEDGATVKIYYESRLAKLELNEDVRPTLDPDFDEITEAEEAEVKERLKSKWARLEAMVGTEKRIATIAADIIDHFERRTAEMPGKAMIVAMSRRICVDLYDAIVKLRPRWHSTDDDKGVIKVVMTGAADDRPAYQPHIRNKAKREALAKRFKDEDSDFKIVIVRDMWLTGFDAPCLHTMYADKPMKGHSLMQAIARVNRVFRDKPGGLVVDYLGLADQLKQAMVDYSSAGGKGDVQHDISEAIDAMQEKLEVVRAMFHGFAYLPILTADPKARIAGMAAAMDFILGLENGKERYTREVALLSKALALAMPSDEALAVRDEVGFFQAVRAGIIKLTSMGGVGGGMSKEDLDAAIRQLIAKAVASDKVIDIFAAAGLPNPDISILSDEFLADVKNLAHRNLALELLHRLLNDEIRTRSQRNIVQARSFADLLERTIRAYQNRSLETAKVIDELITLAKQIREANARGEKLGLNDDEVAFYDALADNQSARDVLGDDTLRDIARELVEKVRNSVTIDWAERESARAKIRVIVKRILKKYGYPPDQTAKAVDLVLDQTKVLCNEWAV